MQSMNSMTRVNPLNQGLIGVDSVEEMKRRTECEFGLQYQRYESSKMQLKLGFEKEVSKTNSWMKEEVGKLGKKWECGEISNVNDFESYKMDISKRGNDYINQLTSKYYFEIEQLNTEWQKLANEYKIRLAAFNDNHVKRNDRNNINCQDCVNYQHYDNYGSNYNNGSNYSSNYSNCSNYSNYDNFDEGLINGSATASGSASASGRSGTVVSDTVYEGSPEARLITPPPPPPPPIGNPHVSNVSHVSPVSHVNGSSAAPMAPSVSTSRGLNSEKNERSVSNLANVGSGRDIGNVRNGRNVNNVSKDNASNGNGIKTSNVNSGSTMKCECEINEGELTHDLKVECYLSQLNSICDKLLLSVKQSKEDEIDTFKKQSIMCGYNELQNKLECVCNILSQQRSVNYVKEQETERCDWRAKKRVKVVGNNNDGSNDKGQTPRMLGTYCDHKWVSAATVSRNNNNNNNNNNNGNKNNLKNGRFFKNKNDQYERKRGDFNCNNNNSNNNGRIRNKSSNKKMKSGVDHEIDIALSRAREEAKKTGKKLTFTLRQQIIRNIKEKWARPEQFGYTNNTN